MSDGCFFCGGELEQVKTVAICTFCGREAPAQMLCATRHHICEDCQLASWPEVVERVSEGSHQKDPAAIANLIMKHPMSVMHSPQHHILVAPVMLAALRNSGLRSIPTGRLASAIARTVGIPVGVCGTRGECGAAVGAGALVSILTGASFMKDRERSLALQATAEALLAIAQAGGPRCCKQSIYLTLEATSGFLKRELSIDLPVAPAATLPRATPTASRKGAGIMLPEWRLLRDGIHEARHHFAVEEALARLVDAGHSPPTLRLRQVYPAVFVGVFQATWSEVDVAYCQAHSIQLVRRPTGGGAVYHEMGSFCFSAFFRRDMFPQSEEELYKLFATPVIRTCADYGVTAHFQGRNDLLVGERKIYGSAQLAWYAAFVQSGTFLVNIDLAVMERALTPPALKFAGKPARSIQERVTSLSRERGQAVETGEVMERFASHAAQVLGVRLVPGTLTPEEQALADELLAVKYSTDEWNFGSRPAYQVTVADKTAAGVVSLSADLEGELIRQARISGDLLLSDQSVVSNLERSLSGSTLPAAQAAVQAAPLTAGIQQSLLRLLDRLSLEVAAVSAEKQKENKR